MLTKDDKTRIKFLIGAALTLITLSIFSYGANGKNLPEIVPISNLSTPWDNKRVAIFGYARSCEAMRGRLGSNNTKCIIVSDLGEVAVYAPFPVYGLAGNRVIVQGVYRESGRFGGLLADHFIVADALIRDWDK